MAPLKSKMFHCAAASLLLSLGSVRASLCTAETNATSCIAREVLEHESLLQTSGRQKRVARRITDLSSSAEANVNAQSTRNSEDANASGVAIGSMTTAVALTPPDVPHDGIKVLHSVERELRMCSNSRHTALSSTAAEIHRALGDTSTYNEPGVADVRRAERRKAFVCAAGCSAREPQLEASLAPWADWQGNFSGLSMLKSLQGFCTKSPVAETSNPFLITVLWKRDVYFKACGVRDIWHPGLYLIGPEDLSMVSIFLLGVQRVATLPPGPIAFGMYLSDYTSLVDHFYTGPGLPMFAYLGHETSWAIPWPSSFIVYSTYETEELQAEGMLQSSFSKADDLAQAKKEDVVRQQPWESRIPKAYWIGTVTGAWDFQMDAGLLAVPRLKLLHLSKEHPQELQAEWSGVAGYGIAWVQDPDEGENISGFMAPHSHSIEDLTGIARADYKLVSEWMDYKYFVNLDGVVMGGRLNKLMALGGVVLQHQAGYTEYFDGLMKPYEHYVPVSYDLSDLTAKIKWLQQNDSEAKRIAENARKLANQRMRLEDHICYVWRALEALGAKTASAEADDTAVENYLEDEGFKRATVKDGSMRSTLESFWGTSLEEVWTGQRKMARSSIEKLQWLWDRFEKLDSQVA